MIVSVFMLISINYIHAQFINSGLEDYMDDDFSVFNESLPISSSTKIQHLTNKPSSPSSLIIVALSTKYTSSNPIDNHTETVFFKNQSASSSISTTTQKIPITVPSVAPYMLVHTLVDQFNHYRNIDILLHIKQCDPKMKFNDMCESYSFDNHTYSLIREANIEFQSFQHLYDALIDRVVVQKLNTHCSTGQWCIENMTQHDIHFTTDVLRQHGRSFCSLEKCHHRLSAYANACPAKLTKNITTPTIKLLPMLCTLYKEPQSWNSNECMKQTVYLLHTLYAFWPQIETCHHIITAGSGGCTAECLIFDSILHNVENSCSQNASFLSRVPALAWYRLINLKQVCRHESIITRPPLMDSVKNFISTNMLWYRLHQRPVYAALFIIVVICIVISFSLCLYVMSKNSSDGTTRYFDDDYEYTRLHDSTFELGANSEIPNTNLSSGRTIRESPFDLNGARRSAEHQRLLHMES
ncbi:unnamed protein product [Adineta steineri]|uniref:Uncharacterized protein n=1 Tax=Adineta steineri TaxID=433720 RepID=A0A818PWM9_9BILA|nr:unnamed protein product [Adineta steineri]